MTKLPLYSIVVGLLAAACAAAQDPPPQDSTLAVKIDTIVPAAGSSFVVEKVAGLDKRFTPIIKRLNADGFSEELLTACFKDRRTVFIPKMTVVKPRSKSASDASAYAWVNTSESADACHAFIQKYSSILRAAQAVYGVDAETLAALLRCETRHGSVTGNYHVFSVYASMALMEQPSFLLQSLDRARAVLKDRQASKGEIDSELEWIRSRAASRSKWAYKELGNMLKIQQRGLTDALGIYGSWAGAFGWGQFLPSSFLLRAVDGNGDRKIDLFDPADAIYSTANYLDKAGYNLNDNAARRRAIRNYNNSTAYVESIIGLAERVKRDEAKQNEN